MGEKLTGNQTDLSDSEVYRMTKQSDATNKPQPKRKLSMGEGVLRDLYGIDTSVMERQEYSWKPASGFTGKPTEGHEPSQYEPGKPVRPLNKGKNAGRPRKGHEGSQYQGPTRNT